MAGDIEKLRKALRNAPRDTRTGPWLHDANTVHASASIMLNVHTGATYDDVIDTGAYVAAACPETVQAILDRMDAAEKELRAIHLEQAKDVGFKP
jgi:hypothetical protein